MKCPDCSAEIPNSNVNIQTDIAQCISCNRIFKISENIGNVVRDGFDINSPPDGTWIRSEMHALIIGATTRSPIAFFLVPFMLVWSGGSIGGIYGMQIVKGEFDPFISLFGIPFIIGSIIFWSITIMAIWGKVELTLNKQGGTVFTGFKSIGLRRTFTWDEVSTISEKQSNFNYPGSQGSSLQLEGKRRISFGMGIKSERRYYLLRSLQIILAKKNSGQSIF